MLTDYLIRDIMNVVDKYSHSETIFERSRPIVRAAFDQYLADNAVVSQDTLGLLGRLNEHKGCGSSHDIIINRNGTGYIQACGGDVLAYFGLAYFGLAKSGGCKTADAAITSLLDLKDPGPVPDVPEEREIAELKQRNKRLCEIAIKQIDEFNEERKALKNEIEKRNEQITEMAQRLENHRRDY